MRQVILIGLMLLSGLLSLQLPLEKPSCGKEDACCAIPAASGEAQDPCEEGCNPFQDCCCGIAWMDNHQRPHLPLMHEITWLFNEQVPVVVSIPDVIHVPPPRG